MTLTFACFFFPGIGRKEVHSVLILFEHPEKVTFVVVTDEAKEVHLVLEKTGPSDITGRLVCKTEG